MYLRDADRRALLAPEIPLSSANWCGCISCDDEKLIEAVRVTDSDEVGAVGLYLATTCASESFEVSDAT